YPEGSATLLGSELVAGLFPGSSTPGLHSAIPLGSIRKRTTPVLEEGLAGAASLSPPHMDRICLSESPSEFCGPWGACERSAEAQPDARTASGASFRRTAGRERCSLRGGNELRSLR